MLYSDLILNLFLLLLLLFLLFHLPVLFLLLLFFLLLLLLLLLLLWPHPDGVEFGLVAFAFIIVVVLRLLGATHRHRLQLYKDTQGSGWSMHGRMRACFNPT